MSKVKTDKTVKEIDITDIIDDTVKTADKKKDALLKKRYSYYKRILDTRGTLNEQQQKIFDELHEQLGDYTPRRTQVMTEDERKKRRQEYYKKNREQIIEYSKQWNKAHRDKVSDYNKRAYEKSKTKKEYL